MTRLTRTLAAMLALIAPVAPAAAQEVLDGGWVRLGDLGVTIEVPAPFASQFSPPSIAEDALGGTRVNYVSDISFVEFSVQRYPGALNAREVAGLAYPPAESTVTYEVDKPDLGVVSGYVDERIYYSACKRPGTGTGALHCFDLVWPQSYRALIDTHVARILRSLG
ncbi:MAG: hypothetical protein AAF321_02095 [Pseudomonadota bacterium]